MNKIVDSQFFRDLVSDYLMPSDINEGSPFVSTTRGISIINEKKKIKKMKKINLSFLLYEGCIHTAEELFLCGNFDDKELKDSLSPLIKSNSRLTLRAIDRLARKERVITINRSFTESIMCDLVNVGKYLTKYSISLEQYTKAFETCMRESKNLDYLEFLYEQLIKFGEIDKTFFETSFINNNAVSFVFLLEKRHLNRDEINCFFERSISENKSNIAEMFIDSGLLKDIILVDNAVKIINSKFCNPKIDSLAIRILDKNIVEKNLYPDLFRSSTINDHSLLAAWFGKFSSKELFDEVLTISKNLGQKYVTKRLMASKCKVLKLK